MPYQVKRHCLAATGFRPDLDQIMRNGTFEFMIAPEIVEYVHCEEEKPRCLRWHQSSTARCVCLSSAPPRGDAPRIPAPYWALAGGVRCRPCAGAPLRLAARLWSGAGAQKPSGKSGIGTGVAFSVWFLFPSRALSIKNERGAWQIEWVLRIL